MGCFDVAHTNRSHELHVLLDQLGGTIRHVVENLVAQFRAGRLQRQDEILVLDLLEHHLNTLVVDEHDVLEDEHESANLLDEIRVFRFERFENALFRRPIGKVENLGDRIDSADALKRL